MSQPESTEIEWLELGNQTVLVIVIDPKLYHLIKHTINKGFYSMKALCNITFQETQKISIHGMFRKLVLKQIIEKVPELLKRAPQILSTIPPPEKAFADMAGVHAHLRDQSKNPLLKIGGIPMNWTFYKALSYSTSIYNVVEVFKGDAEFAQVESLFKKSMPHSVIKRLERVQNLPALERFKKE